MMNNIKEQCFYSIKYKYKCIKPKGNGENEPHVQVFSEPSFFGNIFGPFGEFWESSAMDSSMTICMASSPTILFTFSPFDAKISSMFLQWMTAGETLSTSPNHF